MDNPRLPWEVIESVIHHSRYRPRTLRSISLTCRQLRPRSLCLMVASVSLTSREKAFAFIDFLLGNPHLKPLVYSVVISPTNFGPSLLYILPNLSEIECFSPKPISQHAKPQPFHDLHHSSLACFRRLGTNIQTLRLYHVRFPTSLAFARGLLALANVTHLVCADVVIEKRGNQASLDRMKQHLCREMQLKTLSVSALTSNVSASLSKCVTYPQIDAWSLSVGHPPAGALLFDSIPSMVESLVIMGGRFVYPRRTARFLDCSY